MFVAESSRPISAAGRKMMEAWSVHSAGRKERVAAAAIKPHCRQADSICSRIFCFAYLPLARLNERGAQLSQKSKNNKGPNT
jgi:hypothetical protein